jgi:ATP-dependent Lon protease
MAKIDDRSLIELIQREHPELKKPVPKKLAVLPLRDVVLFPNMIYPILIGRTSSVKATTAAMAKQKFIFVTAQKDPSVDEPTFEDVYTHGTIARILQVMKLPNNLIKVLVEGEYHGIIKTPSKNTEFLEAKIDKVETEIPENDKEFQALVRHADELFQEYVSLNKHLSSDVSTTYFNMVDPYRKLYYAAANIQQKVSEKQKILEVTPLKDQYLQLIQLLQNEIDVEKIEDEIDNKIHESLQKTQKKFIIQEQIRVLQKELGDDDESMPELLVLKNAIDTVGIPEETLPKILEEFDKLKRTSQMSPEYGVMRSYLDLVVALPWSKKTDDVLNVKHVQQILDEDHFGLEKPKERILEYIAILNIVPQLRRQIICLSGPPGVGKTSLGASIARALGREFVRISLGGVRDEAEIRGHRKTYIGAMPGRIIQAMKRAGTKNPVILLDEVDKLASDFRGDPAAALLEVLDPEQNKTFNDHYLEVDFDLSDVIFICTANVKYDIPAPLLDRMEVIELSSYLDVEKEQIASQHIIPKIKKELGLDKSSITFTKSAVFSIIRHYTREAGVRNLEREISTVLRKVAKDIVFEASAKFQNTPKKRSSKKSEDNSKEKPPVVLRDSVEFKEFLSNKTITLSEDSIEKYLKSPRYHYKANELEAKIGVATGLAWTSVGGEILPIEVTMMPGASKLTLTGKLGDVMKESATAALSYVRTNSKQLSVPENFSTDKEIHIHVPEGAVPKDGPSAGITMTVALISAATGKAIRGDIAMTGEVTLRGSVLAIGGLNEKLLAAIRMGIKTVLIPQENSKDIQELNPFIRENLTIIPVKSITEALKYVFVPETTETLKKKGTKKATV